MELNELSIKQALLTKRVSAKQMCKEIELSEPTLYRFYETGKTSPKTEKKIRDYLGLSSETNNVSNISANYDSAEYWRIRCYDAEGKLKESQVNIITLVNTIQVLSLGKRKAVLLQPVYVSQS